ncbi:MAG: hypothetical protein RLZZ535_3557 [Cyanobacteriota bacterium]
MTESTSEPREQMKEVAVKPDNVAESDAPATVVTKPKDSYVKLAMRNMVRKGRQSLWHFFLTTAGLVGLLVGLAYLTKP